MEHLRVRKSLFEMWVLVHKDSRTRALSMLACFLLVEGHVHCYARE